MQEPKEGFDTCRSPHGERGLKLERKARELLGETSLPTRGAWIEISAFTIAVSARSCARCAFSVGERENLFLTFLSFCAILPSEEALCDVSESLPLRRAEDTAPPAVLPLSILRTLLMSYRSFLSFPLAIFSVAEYIFPAIS